MITTEEGNKLIALFDGAIYSKHAEAWGFGRARIKPKQKVFQGVTYQNLVWAERFEKELKYHSDWNWLMPIVEKIESIIFEDDEYYNFQILGGCYVTIISSFGNELVTIDNGKSKLECVWLAVVNFIIWYNEKNKS